ncbi:MAG: hypothetical protein KJ630_03740 [Proteobacteria bacterium]|nr:hypothetical protein [Pseudomonadota bacterium]
MMLEIQRRIHAESEKNKMIDSLQEALREDKVLCGILPICSKCHKIRDDQGYWLQSVAAR